MPSAQSGIDRRIEIRDMGLSEDRGFGVCEQTIFDENLRGF